MSSIQTFISLTGWSASTVYILVNRDKRLTKQSSSIKANSDAGCGKLLFENELIEMVGKHQGLCKGTTQLSHIKTAVFHTPRIPPKCSFKIHQRWQSLPVYRNKSVCALNTGHIELLVIKFDKEWIVCTFLFFLSNYRIVIWNWLVLSFHDATLLLL